MLLFDFIWPLWRRKRKREREIKFIFLSAFWVVNPKFFEVLITSTRSMAVHKRKRLLLRHFSFLSLLFLPSVSLQVPYITIRFFSHILEAIILESNSLKLHIP